MTVFKYSFFALAIAIGTLFAVHVTHATTVTTGTLIKGPGDAVYYYGANNKRFVFPTEKTYKTWYADFSTVVSLSADELSALPLGGNVTYRPGVQLVKITTDPKVYAVATHGTLRWLQTEEVAQTLYGTDWNKHVDDIPDAYFVNYTVGTPVGQASDFSPSTETNTAVDINADVVLKQNPLPTPSPTPSPAPTSTSIIPTLSFNASKNPAKTGDIETLSANVANATSSVKIELYFDSALVQTCSSHVCTSDVLVPTVGGKTSYTTEARATLATGGVLTQTLSISIVTSTTSADVSLRVERAQVLPGQSGSAIVEVAPTISINRVDIFMDGNTVKGCIDGSRLCKWSDVMTGVVGTTHTLYAVVKDSLGHTYTSDSKTITIATNDSPNVTVETAKSTIYTGETVDVSVSASDENGISWIEVWNGETLLKHCDGAAPCSTTTGPWPTSGTILSFTGKAADTKGTVSLGEIQTVSVVKQ